LHSRPSPYTTLFRSFPAMELNVGPFSLRCAGVTGVCTLTGWRGRGLMSALLREGIDDIDRRRLPLSLLKGMRHRYRRFGFEDGGDRKSTRLNSSHVK